VVVGISALDLAVAFGAFTFGDVAVGAAGLAGLGFGVAAGTGEVVTRFAIDAGSPAVVVPDVGPHPAASTPTATTATGTSAARMNDTIPPTHRRFPPRRDCRRPDLPGDFRSIPPRQSAMRGVIRESLRTESIS
jgi:hypothetical protein